MLTSWRVNKDLVKRHTWVLAQMPFIYYTLFLIRLQLVRGFLRKPIRCLPNALLIQLRHVLIQANILHMTTRFML